MEYIYLSRRNNRSGYYILEALLQDGRLPPRLVVLPPYQGRLIFQKMAPSSLENTTPKMINPEHPPFSKSIDELCQQYAIPVISLENINCKDSIDLLHRHRPELIVLGGGWPQLLSANLCAIASLGVINAHPSLLPQYRGTDVHRWQIKDGVVQSGTTIHYVDNTIDTGDIIRQISVPVLPEHAPQDLAENIAKASGSLMIEVLEDINTCKPHRVSSLTQKSHSQTSPPFNRWRWEDQDFLKIDWRRPAVEIARMILAATQEDFRFNGPYFRFNRQIIIVRKATAISCNERQKPVGSLISYNNSPVVQCGEGMLELKALQKADGFWPEVLNSNEVLAGSASWGFFSIRPGHILE